MNKNSPIPMYQQLANTLRAQIRSGELKESDKLMTEAELGEHYQVSRITVRKAIDILSEEEYVVKKQGIGTFVTSEKLNRVVSDNFNKVLSFTETCERDGKKASADVLSVAWVKPSLKIRRQLQLAEDEKTLCVTRLRSSDNKVVTLEETHLPPCFGDLEHNDFHGSIYAMLRDKGIKIAHAAKAIEICYATERESRLLDVRVRQPLLLHSDLGLDEKRHPVIFSKVVINSERYLLTILV